MFSCTFSTPGVSFAIGSTVAILAAVEALHYLELRDESFWLVVEVVDVAPICDTFVCCVDVVQIDYDGAVFCFGGGFFIFASKRSDFGDGSAWEIVSGFK